MGFTEKELYNCAGIISICSLDALEKARLVLEFMVEKHGYVQLAEDQTPPPFVGIKSGAKDKTKNQWFIDGQNLAFDMAYEVGWRRVKLENDIEEEKEDFEKQYIENPSRFNFLKLPMKLRRRLLAEQLMFMDEQDRQKIRDMHKLD